MEVLTDLPYTFSFIIRKRLQIDSLNELPKEKRPPDLTLWWGAPEEIEDWLERVMNSKHIDDENMITIPMDEIEQ